MHSLIGIAKNIWRNKLNALITIASLAIGLAVFSFAFLYVQVETSFDRAWPDADQIHRLLINQHGIPGRQEGVFDNAVARVYPAVVENFADVIELSTRVANIGARLPDANNSYVFVNFVEPAFAEIFQHEVVSGSIERALSGPGFIAVEEATATRLGWTQGSSVTLVGQIAPQGEEPGRVVYEVAAIYRMPPNISGATTFPVLSLMHEYAKPLYAALTTGGMAPWENSNRIWLKLKPGVDLNAIHAAMPGIVDSTVTAFNELLAPGTRISEHIAWRLQPVTDIHFDPGVASVAAPADKGKMLTVAAMGVLVLLAGCSNTVSLRLAAVLERRREIGIRKAAGALPADIRWQFLAESALLALLALVPAVLLVELLMAPFAVLLNIRSVLNFGVSDYAMLALIATSVGLLSGAWPAFVLARVKPQEVLKAGGGSSGSKHLRLRAVLVGGQYCFALMLMIGTLALFVQLQLLLTQPLGYNPKGVLFLRASSQPEIDRAAGLDAALRNVAGLEILAPVNFLPNANLPVGALEQSMISKQQEIVEARVTNNSTSTGFFDLLQIPLLAGRSFDPARDNVYAQADVSSTQGNTVARETSILLNRSATRSLGFASPEAAVEQLVYLRFTNNDGTVNERPPYRVIGVVEDNMYSSVRRRPGPEWYSFIPHDRMRGAQFLLKIAEDADTAVVNADLKRAWQDVTGAPLQSINYLEDQLALAFTTERNESRLLLYCAALALLLSSIGLYGLASYAMERNIKEVGVRKALGANLASLASLYLWRYTRPILLAALIACPVAVYFILQWLQRFPYQLESYWLLPISIVAVAAVLLIALLTVLGLVLKVTRSHPVHALRYE